ncbi:Hypothetical predicted protein [Octopus vulgaris]|uniref:Uncharacterized protein n=1 Tax=Octopus vulgaris TaxID=6645 RepID=A0AA36B7J1_OCTVU|nr:Hypothetical predicted protein [Octopus vulgaris]
MSSSLCILPVHNISRLCSPRRLDEIKDKGFTLQPTKIKRFPTVSITDADCADDLVLLADEQKSYYYVISEIEVSVSSEMSNFLRVLYHLHHIFSDPSATNICIYNKRIRYYGGKAVDFSHKYDVVYPIKSECYEYPT